MSELWINGNMTDVTPAEACLKLIDVKGFIERYVNPHKQLTDAINIGIEAIHRVADPQAKWEESFDDIRRFKCGRCGAEHAVASQYCPSCGARME